MKICLVTTFPPSQGGLSEYGLHIAEELRRNPFLSLTILADKLASPQSELEGFSVRRCWEFDDPWNSLRLLQTIAKLKPDVVWFNLLFSTFGRNPLNAFLGLLTPLLARLSGRYTHVTLHHLMDTVDLKDAGVKHPGLYRAAGAVATRMLLLSNSVSVLMPGYRKILYEKYGHDNVHVRSHGVLTRRPEYPDFARRGNPEHRILAFGKWGTYKRLELMIEAFKIVTATLPNAKLVIGGGDHPQAAGYVESLKRQHAGNAAIEFTGYVDEDRLPGLFQSSSVAVMPYSSSTGCSGVAHLACAYGVPIICADLPDFRQMADGEELAIEFYQPGNAQDLATRLINFLTNQEKQQTMAVQNFSTGLRMTMPTIVLKYLRHFELEQRTEVLRQITRFRRLPGWVPSKSLMLRLMTRNSLGWVHRSAIHPPSANGSGQELSLNGNVDDGGKFIGSSIPLNRYGVAAARYGSGSGVGTGHGSPAARTAGHSDGDDGDESEELSLAPAWGSSKKSEAANSKGQQQASEDWDRIVPLGQVGPGHGSGGNGKSGSSDPGTGSNGSGGERTVQVTRNPGA
ncbi:MAG TPA: glycosyltransferase [Candidatus Sulfotelmatobacter sp.]|nr:glycosyltransferase [Candidatus Sulfotelmatobacter sp.]